MDKQKFIELYIVQFMASYAAVNYMDACGKGSWDYLHIAEDAQVLAEAAWDRVVLTIGKL